MQNKNAIGIETLVRMKTRKTNEKLFVRMRILDHKQEFGHDRYLVTPVGGTGETWVQGIDINKALR